MTGVQAPAYRQHDGVVLFVRHSDGSIQTLGGVKSTWVPFAFDARQILLRDVPKDAKAYAAAVYLDDPDNYTTVPFMSHVYVWDERRQCWVNPRIDPTHPPFDKVPRTE